MGLWGAPRILIFTHNDMTTPAATITEVMPGAAGEQALNDLGSGEFRIPVTATNASAVQEHRIAVVQAKSELLDAWRTVACLEILDPDTDQGTPEMLVVRGPGRLHELTYDNLAYALISNGSGGGSTSWVAEILAYTEENWVSASMDTSSNVGYLQAAGESVWEALLQLQRQGGNALSYNLGEAPQRKIYRINTPLAGSGVFAWDALTLIYTDTPATYEGDANYGVIRDFKIVKRKSETATRVYAYGGGIGGASLTTDLANGHFTPPTGFTVDYANSLITNSTLETSLTFPIVRRKTFPHIKSETNDPDDANFTVANRTAAVQLCQAAVKWLQERVGTTEVYYEVTAVTHGDYVPGQLVTLNHSGHSINSTFVLHSLRHELLASGARLTKFVLGPATRKLEPSGANWMAQSIQGIDETLRHATAPAVAGAPGAGDTINDAQFLLSADHPGLPFRRIAADGLGTVYSDGGAGGDASWGLRTPLSIGMNTANDPGDETTGHTHANDGTLAPAGAGYVVVALSDDLPNERLPAEGNGISIVDDGFGGGNLTWSARLDANGGLEFNSAQIRVRLPTNHGLSRSSAGLALGTPGTITGSTANAVAGGSHTHQLSIGAADLPVHVLATNTGLGAQHSISGATAGHVLRASSSTTAAFAQLQHGDLGGVGANDHHNQSHNIIGSDHTLTTASQYQLVGATAANTLGLLTPSVNGAANSILRMNSSGNLRLGGGSGTAQRRLHIIGSDGAVASFPSSAMTGTESLVVENAGANSSMAIISSANAFSSIKFIESGASTMGGHIFYKHDTGTMVFASSGGVERMYLTEGLRVGLPSSGGDPGQGWINVAGGVQRNGTTYNNPDYVTEHYFHGRIEQFKNNPGAEHYGGLVPLENLKSYLRENLHLPGRWESKNIFDWADMAQMWCEELAIYITQLHERVAELERG